MFEKIKDDIAFVRSRDPAATNPAEILLLYPGLKAVHSHKRAHWCYEHNMHFLARWISQRSVRKTGIEIHPGAKIGEHLFIDHGTGIVIGETAEIGDCVTLYQGVTLGGTGKDVGKRHPTVGNNVMIGAGAKVLGPVKIGDNSKIAAGAVVVKDIPENCTAVGIPAKIVKQDGVRVDYMDQCNIPDPVWTEIERLENKIEELEEKLREKGEER